MIITTVVCDRCSKSSHAEIKSRACVEDECVVCGERGRHYICCISEAAIIDAKNKIGPTTTAFDYAIGDTVHLIEIDRPARIIGLMLNCEGKQFQVVYWDNGARKCEWLFAFELSAKK